MAIEPDSPQVLRRPVARRYVLLTLIVAYALYLLPWGASFFRPSFPLLALIYWCLHEPRKVGHATAFVLGLMVDIADDSLLGEQALSFTIAAHLTLAWRVRILSFKLWQQALHVLALLVVVQLASLVVNFFVAQASAPGVIQLLASLIGAALWPFITYLLELPRNRESGQEAT